MQVTIVDNMGTDLDVVNAARVSFDKESDWEYGDEISEQDRYTDGSYARSYSTYTPIIGLKEKDKKLIKYLAEHNHWSPFSHCVAKFRIKAPIFVARQLAKHQVGFSWNEVSRRYVDSEPEFYKPETWRKKSPDKKQGSLNESAVNNEYYCEYMARLEAFSLQMYSQMIADGICAEQSRMVLPQAVMTEWIMTGSLYAWARLCNLRLKEDTQLETRIIAQGISQEMSKLYPESWKVLVK